jgi:hypothetical protein
MIMKVLKKSFFGIFIILVLGATFGVFKAKADENWQAPATENCQTCHPIIDEFWANGAHGAANVDCSTCHSPYTDHPDEVMPTDVSSRLCGQCHSATMDEWKESVHGQEDLSCTSCHNSHTAALKSDNVQSLCEHCHSERVHIFSFSDHALQGLQCTDCHLEMDESETRKGPGDKVHTFAVDLNACVTCHQEDVHKPHEDTQICDPEERKVAEEQGLVYPCDELEVTQAGLGIPLDEDVLAVEPQDVSPLGFTIIGTLAGVAAGIIAAPWLEKWFRKEREIS